MKKIISTLLVSAVMSLACSLQAQVTKTYLSEDFENQTLSTGWSLNDCSVIGQTTQGQDFYVYQINDGVSVWGGWGYDPNANIIRGGLSQELDGTYSLITKPFTLEEDVVNVLVFDYWYLGQASNDSNRLFGVSIREGNGEWKVLDSIQKMTNKMVGRMEFTLDEELAGKSVQLQFFFRNKHRANTYFMFLMDNIQFAAYKNAPYCTAEIKNPAYYAVEKANEDNVPLDLVVNNGSLMKLTSFEFAYTTNNGNTQQTITFTTDTLAPLTGSASANVSVKFTNGEFGSNSIKMWPVKINGTDVEVPENDTTNYQIVLVDKSMLSGKDFVPMMECFTSATCPPCATLNRLLNPVLEDFKEAGQLNVVKYQMNFPNNGDKYYIATNRTRMQYYDQVFGWGGYWGVPSPIYNAEVNISDYVTQAWSDCIDPFKQLVEEAQGEKALMDIVIKDAKIDASTGKLDFEIEASSAIEISANVVVVITEKTTKGNRGSNGEREFHYVTMSAPLGANGKVYSFKPGDVVRISESEDMSGTHMEEATDLEIVCFVQAPLASGAKIFQSASAEVTALNVANESRLAAAISVYPNPAKNNVSIKGLENASVSVFDMTGRMVYSTKAAEESLNMDLSRFVAGTYMIRVEQNGNTIHKKLVVTK